MAIIGYYGVVQCAELMAIDFKDVALNKDCVSIFVQSSKVKSSSILRYQEATIHQILVPTMSFKCILMWFHQKLEVFFKTSIISPKRLLDNQWAATLLVLYHSLLQTTWVIVYAILPRRLHLLIQVPLYKNTKVPIPLKSDSFVVALSLHRKMEEEESLSY